MSGIRPNKFWWGSNRMQMHPNNVKQIRKNQQDLMRAALSRFKAMG